MTSADPDLLALLRLHGRPAVLDELKARGLGIRERQALATALARDLRAATAGPVPVPRQQPHTAPLIVGAEAGLCNKLRCVLSYLQAARDQGRHLIVLWRIGSFCDVGWEDLFEPIDGLTVLTDQSAIEEALLHQGVGIQAVPGTFGAHPSIEGDHEREVAMWAPLRPREHIQKAIHETVARCGQFAAVHIRRTDFLDLFGIKTGDGAFEGFLRKHVADGCNAYVATDNAETQRHFEEVCGEQFRSYRTITASPLALRQTSVADAVVDIFTCASAVAFAGTRGSSFSDAIWAIRRLRGVAAHDAHDFDRPVHTRPSPGNECDFLLTPPLPHRLLEAMRQPLLSSDADSDSTVSHEQVNHNKINNNKTTGSESSSDCSSV